MKSLQLFLATLAFTTALSCKVDAAEIIADGEFINWSFSSFADPPEGDATVTREETGGNPGAHLRIATNPTLSGHAWGLAIFDGFSSNGPLIGAEFTLSLEVRNFESIAGQHVYLLVKQGDSIYELFVGNIDAPLDAFIPFEFNGTLNPLKFVKLIGDGPASPDFSGEVETLFGLGGSNGVFGRTYDYDNYILQIGPTPPQCNDAFDNDQDGLIDFPNDPGCDALDDNDESDTLPIFECNDEIDNDLDGLIDFPDDPGCDSSSDDNEFNSSGVLLPVDIIDPAGLIVVNGATRDPETGLDWLDLTLTSAFKAVFDDVAAGIGPGAGPGVGWTNDGWRIASAEEVCTLFARYVGVSLPCPNGSQNIYSPTDAQVFVDLFGVTLADAQLDEWTLGLYDDDSTPGEAGLALVISNGLTSVEDDQRSSNTGWDDAGIFLVRPEPEGIPDIQVPSVINFGEVNLDLNVGYSEFILIRNIGNADLKFLGFEFLSPQGDFSAKTIVPCGPVPCERNIIKPGGILGGIPSAIFHPTKEGRQMATLGIRSDDPITPLVSVQLMANGVSTGPSCAGLQATIVGSENDDIINGTSADDVIVGLGGNDLIYGNDGNDVICGGSGNDAIFGNSGSDTIYGETGQDSLLGGDGNDLLLGGAGIDVLDGGEEDDILSGNEGNDRIYGGSGNDELNGDTGDDILVGQDGTDSLNGGDGLDICDKNISSMDIIAECEVVPF